MCQEYRTKRLVKTLIFSGFLHARIKIANELGALLAVMGALPFYLIQISGLRGSDEIDVGFQYNLLQPMFGAKAVEIFLPAGRIGVARHVVGVNAD